MTAPWLMWGTSQVVPLTAFNIGTNNIIQAQQIASIRYGRPESWRFFFQSSGVLNLIGGGAQNVAVTTTFSLILGLGRGQISLPQFEVYTPVVALLGNNTVFNYSSEVIAPLRFPADPNVSRIQEIVAETIQCTASVNIGSSTGTGTYQGQVSAFFAPATHIRPEWWKIGRGAEEFPGGEDHGT